MTGQITPRREAAALTTDEVWLVTLFRCLPPELHHDVLVALAERTVLSVLLESDQVVDDSHNAIREVLEANRPYHDIEALITDGWWSEILDKLFQDGLPDALLGTLSSINAYSSSLIEIINETISSEYLDIGPEDVATTKGFLHHWRDVTLMELQRRAAHRRYWATFARFLQDRESTFRIERESYRSNFDFPTKQFGVTIVASIDTASKLIQVALRLDYDDTRLGYRQLEAERLAIEAEFGEALDWAERSGKDYSRIAVVCLDADPSEEANFADLHPWMLGRMERFRWVFANRVRGLTPDLDDESADS